MTKVPFADKPEEPPTLFGMPVSSPPGFPNDQIAFVGSDGKVKGAITGLSPTGRAPSPPPEPIYSISKLRPDYPIDRDLISNPAVEIDAKEQRHRDKIAVYKLMYGGRADEPGIDYAALEERIIAFMGQQQTLDERLIEALIAAGLDIRVNDYHDGPPAALLPRSMKKAHDAVLARARKQRPWPGPKYMGYRMDLMS